MRDKKLWLGWLFLLGMSCSGMAQEPRGEFPASVKEALAHAQIPLSGVSVMVQVVGEKSPRLVWNEQVPRLPASLMKLVTTYAALLKWGPTKTWVTRVWGQPARAGVVSGNLYVQSEGDPALSFERWQQMWRQLRNQGMREIRGDIVIQGPAFAMANQDPSAFDGLGYRAYNAIPGPLDLASRTELLHIVPLGKQIRVYPEIQLPEVRLVSHLLGDSGPCPADWKQNLALQVEDEGPRATVRLDGRLSLQCQEKTLSLHVLDDVAWIEALFRASWRELGGTFAGHVVWGKIPADLPLLEEMQSPALASQIGGINKNSNNLMARTLFLELGENAPGSAALTSAQSIQEVKRLLGLRGMHFPELVLENGSGLSRQEQITPAHLNQLLQDAAQNPLQPEFMASLAWIGEEGTLLHRFEAPELVHRFRLKTGSIQGVNALAGYGLNAKGQWVSLVFMANDARAGASKEAQEALLRWIEEQP